MYKLHAYARGDMGIIENIIFAKLKEIAMSVASTMSSNDAIENYAKFNEGIRSKIINNTELKERGIFIEQFSITGISFDRLTTGQFQKQQEIELAKGLSELDKFKMTIDKETSIGVAEAWANGISKMKLPETFMLGGSGTQGGMNPMETFFNLMNVSTAKELASKKESK